MATDKARDKAAAPAGIDTAERRARLSAAASSLGLTNLDAGDWDMIKSAIQGTNAKDRAQRTA